MNTPKHLSYSSHSQLLKFMKRTIDTSLLSDDYLHLKIQWDEQVLEQKDKYTHPLSYIEVRDQFGNCLLSQNKDTPPYLNEFLEIVCQDCVGYMLLNPLENYD